MHEQPVTSLHTALTAGRFKTEFPDEKLAHTINANPFCELIIIDRAPDHYKATPREGIYFASERPIKRIPLNQLTEILA